MPESPPPLDPDELAVELERAFGGRKRECDVVARQARDLADSGKPEEDRGRALTVAEVVRQMGDAPEGSGVADRWNWWLGSLDVAYGGYREFQVTRF